VGLGMLASAAACAAFGTGSTALVLALAFGVNGLAQATGWSGNVKAMAGAFGPSERGTVMGLWSTNYQVGGLAATALATVLLTHWGWRSAFFVPAIAVGAVGLGVLSLLPESQGKASPPLPSAVSSAPDTGPSVLRSPVLWSIGAAYFCLKLIRYSILFWLPFYLKTALGYSEAAAGYWSISFEVGGIVGAVAVGWSSDRWFPGKRRELSAAMTVGLALALLLYRTVAPWGVGANALSMALVGFCLFGPDALISGAAAQDLGGQRQAATAAGAINGLGSAGAILQGYVTASISNRYGWSALYGVFTALALAAALALRLGQGAPVSRDV